MAAVVLARSNPFDASLKGTLAASAATRSGNIDGETTANSARRRAAATSIESSQPRTRRTSSQHRRHRIRVSNRHIDSGDRFDQPDNNHDTPSTNNAHVETGGGSRYPQPYKRGLTQLIGRQSPLAQGPSPRHCGVVTGGRDVRCAWAPMALLINGARKLQAELGASVLWGDRSATLAIPAFESNGDPRALQIAALGPVPRRLLRRARRPCAARSPHVVLLFVDDEQADPGAIGRGYDAHRDHPADDCGSRRPRARGESADRRGG